MIFVQETTETDPAHSRTAVAASRDEQQPRDDDSDDESTQKPTEANANTKGATVDATASVISMRDLCGTNTSTGPTTARS